MVKNFLFLLSLFANIWIWKIFSANLPLFILISCLSFFVYLLIGKTSFNRIVIPMILLFVVMLVQYKYTDRNNLSEIRNEDRWVIDTRLTEYPPIFVGLANKRFWIPAAYWFEQRKEMIIWSRVKKNIFEFLDINYYYFAGHPRERVGYKEFEKFPYINLPFFIYGAYLLTLRKQKTVFLFFVLPQLMTAFIGEKNPLGNFSVIPFFTAATALGLNNAYNRLSRVFVKRSVLFIVLLLLLLIICQTYLYEAY